MQFGVNLVEIMKKAFGDCIDCGFCVKVCFIGIDICDGMQFECVNCIVCIDVCDEVMDKIDWLCGFICYDSYNGIEFGRKKFFIIWVFVYIVVLALFVVVNIVLLMFCIDVEILLLCIFGIFYQKVDEMYISNFYNYQVINKIVEEVFVEFKFIGDIFGWIRFVGKLLVVVVGKVAEGVLFIDLDKVVLEFRKIKVIFEVYFNGEFVDKVKINFLGLVK